MESTALPISNFGIQQATAGGEPRYFRLKKTVLIVIFVLSFLGKLYIISVGEEAVEHIEGRIEDVDKILVATEEQGQMSATNKEAGQAIETLMETSVKHTKTLIVMLVIGCIVDLVFIYGVYTERVLVAKVIAILESAYAAFRILGLLFGISGFITTGLTIALAVLSVLYWIDLKNMATDV